MKSIREGDLYFLESPFHTDMDAKLEKRLSYLLGTVSSRPAVVVRAPNWWDQYNTVTVIPAISKGEPAIIFHLQDRYGCLTESDYPFMPHNPHTIPVARLGKHIGSLDSNELQDLLYAFHWIHDPSMQADTSKPIPPIYKALTEKEPMKSWSSNRDARSNVRIFVKPDMTLESMTNPELNGMKLDINLHTSVNPKVLTNVESELEYYKVETKLPDNTVVKNAAETKNVAGRVPVEKSFPPSVFDYNTLCNIAGRFTISDAYYRNERHTRLPLLNENEIDAIYCGRVNLDNLEKLYKIYLSFTPMDAYLLGPRLPSSILAQILNIPTADAVNLKHICNIMRDMSDAEYMRRLNESNLQKAQESEVEKPVEVPVSEAAQPVTIEGGYTLITDKNELARALRSINTYLTPTQISSIPPALQETFIRIPKYAIKRQYRGANFTKAYALAYEKYIKALNSK